MFFHHKLSIYCQVVAQNTKFFNNGEPQRKKKTQRDSKSGNKVINQFSNILITHLSFESFRTHFGAKHSSTSSCVLKTTPLHQLSLSHLKNMLKKTGRIKVLQLLAVPTRGCI